MPLVTQVSLRAFAGLSRAVRNLHPLLAHDGAHLELVDLDLVLHADIRLERGADHRTHGVAFGALYRQGGGDAGPRTAHGRQRSLLGLG
eukprot:scaffold27474_cov125-Isochrysis_galbana.AAC.2